MNNNPISPSFWYENCRFTPEEKRRLKRLPDRKKPSPDKAIERLLKDCKNHWLYRLLNGGK